MVLQNNLVRAIALVGMMTAAPALAQPSEDANAAVNAWLAAVASGDAGELQAILAPEFQIQRADGTGLDKAEYVDGGAANLSSFEATDLVATRDGDIMVVRYTLLVSETIDGEPMQATAPRLTVFRWDGERWLVVAHANFARAEQPN